MAAPVVLDANLAVLFFVGWTDRTLISRHKRLNAFSEDDFDQLVALVSNASEILFTPNVLTETSNIARQIAEPYKSKISITMQALIPRAQERYVTSSDASQRNEFSRLGLTDSVLLLLSQTGATILTVDLDLYLAALNAGYNAVNYNHLRSL